ncbi:hypothetical protein TWF281_007898 [Arthrobotrys megalospora]
MHFQPPSPLTLISTLLLISFQASSWFLLTLRRDRKWTVDGKPSSSSTLNNIESLTECIHNTNSDIKGSIIDAIALYNRPGSSAARAVGLYTNQNCGIPNPKPGVTMMQSIRVGTHVPDILVLLDQNQPLDGVHLVDLRNIGVETSGKFYRAIDPTNEIGSNNGLLEGSGLMPGVYWWDGKGTWQRRRHFDGVNRMKYEYCSVVDYLRAPAAFAFKEYRRIAWKQMEESRTVEGENRPTNDNPHTASVYSQPVPTSGPAPAEMEKKKPSTEVNRGQLSTGQWNFQMPIFAGPGFPSPYFPLDQRSKFMAYNMQDERAIVNNRLQLLKAISEMFGMNTSPNFMINPNPSQGLEGGIGDLGEQAGDGVGQNQDNDNVKAEDEDGNGGYINDDINSLDIVRKNRKVE